MILADTNIWISYFKDKNKYPSITERLHERQISTHSWIVGELMLGNLGPQRMDILSTLRIIPHLPEYPTSEIQEFIQEEKLYGKGLSLIDVHLLYSSLRNHHALWTADKQLEWFARKFRCAHIDFH